MLDPMDVSPETIEAVLQGMRPSIPYAEPERQDVHIELPSLNLIGRSGWLCHVCLRVPLADRRPWSWFGCERCRAVDVRVASLFGGRRFLPLGQHSMMNGLSIDIHNSTDLQAQAGADQMVAMASAWKALDTWHEHQISIHVEQWHEEHGAGDESVTLTQWQERYPPDTMASAMNYAALLDNHFPWVFEAAPQACDVLWLAGVQL